MPVSRYTEFLGSFEYAAAGPAAQARASRFYVALRCPAGARPLSCHQRWSSRVSFWSSQDSTCGQCRISLHKHRCLQGPSGARATSACIELKSSRWDPQEISSIASFPVFLARKVEPFAVGVALRPFCLGAITCCAMLHTHASPHPPQQGFERL